MMKKFVVLAALVAVTCCTSAAHAAAFGSSILKVSDAKLQQFVGGTWVNANPVEFSAFTNTFTVNNDASLSGYGTAGTSTTASFDAPQAYVGSGTAPVENTFASNGIINAYSRADTSGSGNLLGVPGFVQVNTLSEINGLANELGFGGADISSSGTVRFQALFDGIFRLSLNADLALQTISDATSLVTASVAFGANINAATVGAPPGSFFTVLAPLALNTSISGNGAITSSGPFFSDSFELVKDRNYSFTINQGSRASILSATTVPEPASLGVFGLLSLAAVAVRRRRS